MARGTRLLAPLIAVAGFIISVVLRMRLRRSTDDRPDPEISARVTPGLHGRGTSRVRVTVINPAPCELVIQGVKVIAPAGVELKLFESLAYPLIVEAAGEHGPATLEIRLVAKAGAASLDHGSLLIDCAWQDRKSRVLHLPVRIEGSGDAFWEPAGS